MSPCWGEANFVKVFGAPIVFRHMDFDEASGRHVLRYAGSRSEIFDPKKLQINKDGLLLHEIELHEHLKIGSFDTNLACELAENLHEATSSNDHAFSWNGETYILKHQQQMQ